MREFANALVVAFLCAAETAYAHGGRPGHIDEGPSPGTWITIIMVVSWVVIAIGIFLLVRRLIRTKGPEKRSRNK